jgi:hypothetical protein
MLYFGIPMTPCRAVASVLVALVLAGVLAGCASNNDRGEPTGSLAVTLAVTADADPARTAPGDPGEALSRVGVALATVSGLEGRLADGTWVPVDTGLPVTVDLIAVMNSGTAAALLVDRFPEGEYDALQLRITQVQLTLHHGTQMSMGAPDSGWTVLLPVNFGVVAGQSTTVSLALHAKDSFRSFDGQLAFEPEIEIGGIAHD